MLACIVNQSEVLCWFCIGFMEIYMIYCECWWFFYWTCWNCDDLGVDGFLAWAEGILSYSLLAEAHVMDQTDKHLDRILLGFCNSKMFELQKVVISGNHLEKSWSVIRSTSAVVLVLSLGISRQAVWISPKLQWRCGCGSKRNPLGTTGFGLFFLSPIRFFGYPFLTHSHVWRCNVWEL